MEVDLVAISTSHKLIMSSRSEVRILNENILVNFCLPKTRSILISHPSRKPPNQSFFSGMFPNFFYYHQFFNSNKFLIRFDNTFEINLTSKGF